MNRQGFWIGFLAGGWLATIGIVVFVVVGLPNVNLGSHLGVGLEEARAEDPVIPIPVPVPGTPPIGPSVNSPGSVGARGTPNPGIGTSDSNRRAIALSASIGGGQSVVYYFDTVAQRLCVYQYEPGSRGGLRLLAARLIDFDLKLEQYRDLSEKTPREMREAYEKQMGVRDAGRGGRTLPTKQVNLPGGTR